MGGRRGRAAKSLQHRRARSTPTPATPPRGRAIPPRTIMCCWRTWSRCSTSGAGGRRRTRRCGASISMPPPWSGGSPGPAQRSSWAMGSRRTRAPPAGSGTGGSPASPTRCSQLHSKRSAEIEAECERRGEGSYRAEGCRRPDHPAGQGARGRGGARGPLAGRARSAGWPVERLAAVGRRRPRSRPADDVLKEARRLVSEILGDDGDLARRKVFSRRHVIVALAPHLYGQHPALLDALVDRALADPETVPLVGVKGAREKVHSLASVLARETAIAESLGRQLARSDAPAASEAALGRRSPRPRPTMGVQLSGEQRGRRLRSARPDGEQSSSRAWPAPARPPCCPWSPPRSPKPASRCSARPPPARRPQPR